MHIVQLQVCIAVWVKHQIWKRKQFVLIVKGPLTFSTAEISFTYNIINYALGTSDNKHTLSDSSMLTTPCIVYDDAIKTLRGSLEGVAWTSVWSGLGGLGRSSYVGACRFGLGKPSMNPRLSMFRIRFVKRCHLDQLLFQYLVADIKSSHLTST